jgi:prepilin-type N-terminal cleavage/methylation domain-containing protein
MRRGQQGFTLVEMMVSIAIFTVVTVAMAGTFLVGFRAIGNEARVIAADTAVSEASIWLTRDLNSANTLPAGAVTIDAANSFSTTYGASPGVTIVYSVDANRNLIRTVNNVAEVAARGITSVGITPAGCYTTVTIQPSAAGAAAVTLNVSNRPGGCF